jgi:hypothetical protein
MSLDMKEKHRKTPGSHSFHIENAELVLIIAGLLFFASVLNIATGGDFSVLFVAKLVYVGGILVLAINYATE